MRLLHIQICFFCLFITQLSSQSLIPIFNNEKIGFMNSEGQVIVEPIWSNATRFSEGLASVRRTEKYGYINEKGKMVIAEQFDFALPFRNGRAVVYMDGEKKEIDQTGKFIPTEEEVILGHLAKFGIKEFAFISKFPYCNYTIVYLEKGLYGKRPVLFDKDLNPVSQPDQYDAINWGYNNYCQAMYPNSIKADIYDGSGKVVFTIHEKDTIYIERFFTVDSMLVVNPASQKKYWINRNRKIRPSTISLDDYISSTIRRINPENMYSYMSYVGRIGDRHYFKGSRTSNNGYSNYLFLGDGTLLFEEKDFNWGDVYGEQEEDVIVFESEISQTVFNKAGKIIYRNVKTNFQQNPDKKIYQNYRCEVDSIHPKNFTKDIWVDTTFIEKRVTWGGTHSLQDHYRFYLNPTYYANLVFKQKSKSFITSNAMISMEYFYKGQWMSITMNPHKCFADFPNEFKADQLYFAQVPIYGGDLHLPCRIHIKIVGGEGEILFDLFSNPFYNHINSKVFNGTYDPFSNFDDFVYHIY